MGGVYGDTATRNARARQIFGRTSKRRVDSGDPTGGHPLHGVSHTQKISALRQWWKSCGSSSVPWSIRRPKEWCIEANEREVLNSRQHDSAEAIGCDCTMKAL